MTAADRVQLEKDILYEHRKAEQDFQAQMIVLRRWQERVQSTADKLRVFALYVETGTLRKDGAPSGEVSEIGCEEINQACREALALRERLDQLARDKKALGL
jgi:hypothetical protein